MADGLIDMAAVLQPSGMPETPLYRYMRAGRIRQRFYIDLVCYGDTTGDEDIGGPDIAVVQKLVRVCYKSTTGEYVGGLDTTWVGVQPVCQAGTIDEPAIGVGGLIEANADLRPTQQRRRHRNERVGGLI